MLHDTAIIEGFVHSTAKIWAFVHVGKNGHISEGTSVGEGSYIDGIVGKNCKIQNGTQIFHGVTLENNVFIAPNVVFTNDILPVADGQKWDDRFRATVVKKGASIGANATIVCGVIIGEGAIVGAGSVVTKNIPANQIWVGNPAKFLKNKI